MSRGAIHCESFPPLLGGHPRVLVLGSMPGRASLEAGRYYAHPRNAFWSVMGALVGAGPELSYEKRTQRLTAAGIALWDVLAYCEREGSLDTAIAVHTEQPNAVAELIAAHDSLRAVFLNGGKPMSAFRRHILPAIDTHRLDELHIQQLPSTSPANARSTIEDKISAWRVVGKWL